MAKKKTSGRFAKPGAPRTPVKKLVPILLILLAVSITAFGGTMAYILTNSNPVDNSFIPAYVDCVVSENFNGTTKTDVKVQNTGNTDAYIRVKLLPYYYDEKGNNIIGKGSWEPTFQAESGWIQGNDGYWYYTQKVAPNGFTTALISSITLQQDDVTLTREALEIIASAIQAEPVEALTAAGWGYIPNSQSGS